eukprot:Skav218729  [mRNA]  locus=scaffold1346:831297:832389:+ [translate_table: standard]
MSKVLKLGGAETPAPVATLSKARALALQTELLDAFSAPKFQKKLHEIARKTQHSAQAQPAQHSDSSDSNEKKLEEKSKAHSSFKHLVRKSQREIIPRYGFDASEEGVECMMKAFRQLKDDPDIYVNACAIKEALSLDHGQLQSEEMKEMTPSLSESLSPEGTAPPTVRNLVMLWLRRLTIRFSTPTFQAFKTAAARGKGPTSEEVAMEDPAQGAQGSPGVPGVVPEPSNLGPLIGDIHGYYHLLARADAKGGTKSKALEGVKMMIKEICILEDAEVVKLFNTMNMKLGMAADACGPFRDSLRLHLIQALQQHC